MQKREYHWRMKCKTVQDEDVGDVLTLTECADKAVEIIMLLED